MLRKSRGPRPVFVLGMDSNGLGVVRSLGREGIPCVGVDSSRTPGMNSRYCKPLMVSNPDENPEKALDMLLSESTDYLTEPILIPTTDQFVLFMSRHRSNLESHFLFILPSTDLIESLLNKRRQYELAERLHVPYPKTYFAETLGEVERLSREVEYPVFIKPYRSYFWQSRFKTKGFLANNSSELIARYKLIFSAKLDALVQSVVTGPDTNIIQVYAYISRKYEPLAIFTARKLRQFPNNFGVATFIESAHDEEASRVALRFYQSTRYTGMGAIELKRDERDGKYKLVELNPRLAMHNSLATYCGLNFPLIQYFDLIGSPIAAVDDYKDSVKWLDLVQDFRSVWGSRGDYALWMRRWISSVRSANCHAYFAEDDLKPLLNRYLLNISLFVNRVAKT